MARSNNATQANWYSLANVFGLTGGVYPFSMACWFNPNQVTTYQALVNLVGGTAGTDWHTLGLFGQVAGDPVVAYSGGAGNESQAQTSTSYVASTWQHAAGVWLNASSRTVYLNGGGKITDTGTRNVTGLTLTTVGGNRVGSTTFGPLDGSVAEVAIWNVALTDADVLQLSKKFSPLSVRFDALVAYFPLIGRVASEPDMIAGAAFTQNGTMSQAAHSPIINPRQPQLMIPSVVAARSGVMSPYNNFRPLLVQ